MDTQSYLFYSDDKIQATPLPHPDYPSMAHMDMNTDVIGLRIAIF